MDKPSNDVLFEQMMTACRHVFVGRHFEASHHLLNAAIHFAHDVENEGYLLDIKQLAEEQYAWINNHAPESIMSAHSAHKREGVDMYAVTIRQAAAHASMIRENRRRRASPHESWPEL